MNAITKIFSISFIILLTNVSVAEQLTDIKITSPVMNETMTTREAIEDINTKNSVERYTVIYEYIKKYYLWALNKMKMENEDITKQQNFETSDNPPLEIWNINLTYYYAG